MILGPERTLRVVVIYLAIDMAAYQITLRTGSGLALAIFLVLTVAPSVVVPWWVLRCLWRDHTRTTLY